MTHLDDDALLDALGVDIAPAQVARHTPQEERLIAGFEDILRFHAAHGRAPRHGAQGDIFERLYAVRLERLRQLPQARALLAPLDAPGLLAPESLQTADLDEDALLAHLGAGSQPQVRQEGSGGAARDISVLRHVRSSTQRNAAQEVADRTPCLDFEAHFQPLFEQAERELKSGARQALRFGRDASIAVGDFFVLGGQTAFVAEMGEPYRTPNNQLDARLRVVYSNATESDLLLRSLQRALYKDRTGRRLTEPAAAGPLFGDAAEGQDLASGTIYVLRSQSQHPFIAEHRELVHKIGVTGGRVEDRIAGAAREATYLLAEGEVVACYQLLNLNRARLENLFHRLFGAAQLELEIADRFGHPVKPREWFLVPLPVIDEAVQRIRDGSIAGLVYDPAQARLVPDS